MNCDICRRAFHSQRLPAFCPVDARNRLYEGRVAHATALIENEALQKRIESLLRNEPPLGADADPAAAAVQAETMQAEEAAVTDRTAQIIAQAEKLRAEVDEARKDIEDRKRKLAKRKEDLAEASQGLDARRSRQLAETQKSVQRTKFRWNMAFKQMTVTREFLCTESARLYGLRRIKKGSSVKYQLGGIDILELRNMITASPESITTSLAHIAHLLMLASHYLSIRLPAEIVLPHDDYPRPTIFSLVSSYRHGDIPYPGSVVIPSTAVPDENAKSNPRPRPLFVDKPLLILAKEEPSTYSLFVEGVVLLAYNIAWACYTQGVPVGDKGSHEDICNMGRNLYNLLISSQQFSQVTSHVTGNSDQGEGAAGPSNADQLGGNPKPMMGCYSHGAAHNNLNSAEGTDFMRSLRLPNPVKLADRLKKKMLSDADGLDWEMLNDDAWAPDDEPMEEGVQKEQQQQSKGKGRAHAGETMEDDRRLYGVESVISTMTTRTALDSTLADFDRVSLDDAPSPERATTKTSGTSGWTRIKSRQPDT